MALQLQFAAIGVHQLEGAVGALAEVVGGEGLQAIERFLFQVAAEVVVVLRVELRFQVGFQHPVAADALGVVVDEGGAPAVGAGRDIGVLRVVLAQRQGDQGQQAAVAAPFRVVDEEQGTADLGIAETGLAGMPGAAGQARIDVDEGNDELRRAESAADVAEEHLAVGHRVGLQFGLAVAIGRPVELMGAGRRQVEYAERGARRGAEEVAGVEVGGAGLGAQQERDAEQREGAGGRCGHRGGAVGHVSVSPVVVCPAFVAPVVVAPFRRRKGAHAALGGAVEAVMAGVEGCQPGGNWCSRWAMLALSLTPSLE